MSRYVGLTDYLAQVILSEVKMSFPEIEAVIGHRLPKSATHTVFWENPANRAHHRGMKRAVRAADFRSILLPEGKVLFVRN